MCVCLSEREREMMGDQWLTGCGPDLAAAPAGSVWRGGGAPPRRAVGWKGGTHCAAGAREPGSATSACSPHPG